VPSPLLVAFREINPLAWRTRAIFVFWDSRVGREGRKGPLDSGVPIEDASFRGKEKGERLNGGGVSDLKF